jgi:hypothetical protein
VETVATQLKQMQDLPTHSTIKQTFIQALSQELPTWEIPAQERGMVAVYITPLLLTKAVEVLQPLLNQKQKDQQAEMIVKIFDLLNTAQQTVLPSITPPLPSRDHPTPIVSSDATILEQKMQKSAYDVYICYNEEYEAEVFAIGEALKVHGILPWFDFLGKPGVVRGKQQEHLIEVIPAAAIFMGQYAIAHWQEVQMYAFLQQLVERGCSVIPVLLKSDPLKPKLPPFLGTLVWVDFRRSVPDPLTQFIWGITNEQSGV